MKDLDINDASLLYIQLSCVNGYKDFFLIFIMISKHLTDSLDAYKI